MYKQTRTRIIRPKLNIFRSFLVSLLLGSLSLFSYHAGCLKLEKFVSKITSISFIAKKFGFCGSSNASSLINRLA
jgi:hypothetical protein